MEANLIPNNSGASSLILSTDVQQPASGFQKWLNGEAKRTLPESLLNFKTPGPADLKFLKALYYLETRGTSTDQTASNDQEIDTFIDELKTAATEEAECNSTDTPASLKLTNLLKVAVDFNFPGALKQLADLLCTDIASGHSKLQYDIRNNLRTGEEKYLEMAADQLHHIEAAYQYAGCCAHNDNNFSRIEKYLTQAADSGHFKAQQDLYVLTGTWEKTKYKYCYSIGVAYLNGNSQYDVQPNYKVAHKHLTLAAEKQKDPRAIYLLGHLSLMERGTVPHELLTRAATIGDLVQKIDSGDVEAAYQFFPLIEEKGRWLSSSSERSVICQYCDKAANLLCKSGEKLLLDRKKTSDEKAAAYFIRAGGYQEDANKIWKKMFSDGRGICTETEDKAFEFFESEPLITTPHIKRQLQVLNPERYEIFLTREAEALHPGDLTKYINSLLRPIVLNLAGERESLRLLAELLCAYPEAREVLGSKFVDIYLHKAADDIAHAGAAFLRASLQIQALYREHFPLQISILPVTPRVLASQLSSIEHLMGSTYIFDIQRYYKLAARQSHFAAQEIWANTGNCKYAFSVGIEYLYGNQELDIEADEESAVHYLTIAVNDELNAEDKAIASFLLAGIYEKNGDDEKADKYFRIAAKLGHAPALLVMKVNKFAKAENANNETQEKMADATYRLSCLLREENVLLFPHADVHKANKYVALAAANGNINAMQDVVDLEKKGIVVCDSSMIADYEKQIQTVNSTQKQPDEKMVREAHYINGKSYLQGYGIKPKYVLALQSFSLAAEQGHQGARNALNQLISNGVVLEAICAEITKANFQERLTTLKVILKADPIKLILILAKVTDRQIPGALTELATALIATSANKFIPADFEIYLKQAADVGHADAAYRYAKILEARESKLSFFDKMTSVFSKDSTDYLKIAAANGHLLAIQELIKRGDISKDGMQVNSTSVKVKEFDGYDV
jgi:TPR repeat protein